MKRLIFVGCILISLTGCLNRNVDLEEQENYTEEQLKAIEEEESLIAQSNSNVTREEFYNVLNENEKLKHKEEKIGDGQTDFLFISRNEAYRISYWFEPNDGKYIGAIEVEDIKEVTEEFLSTMKQIFEVFGEEFDPELMTNTIKESSGMYVQISDEMSMYSFNEDFLRIEFNSVSITE